jgi:hypothetical protein
LLKLIFFLESFVLKGWWSGGFGYGLWIGILVSSGFTVVPVPSFTWKAKFELSGSKNSKVGLVLTIQITVRVFKLSYAVPLSMFLYCLQKFRNNQQNMMLIFHKRNKLCLLKLIFQKVLKQFVYFEISKLTFENC